jgi:hypothetical protein
MSMRRSRHLDLARPVGSQIESKARIQDKLPPVLVPPNDPELRDSEQRRREDKIL